MGLYVETIKRLRVGLVGFHSDLIFCLSYRSLIVFNHQYCKVGNFSTKNKSLRTKGWF